MATYGDGAGNTAEENSSVCSLIQQALVAFNALTLLLDGRKGIRPVKNGRMVEVGTLVSPDGVPPSRMVSVSASVNLPLHHKFSSGTSSPRWYRKKGHKTVVVVVVNSLP